MTFLLAGVLDPRGPAARDIVGLWWLMFALGTAVFLLFAVVLALGLRRRGPDTPAGQEAGQSRWWLHGGGVALPAVGVLVVLVATLVVMQRNPETVDANSTDHLVVEAIASQYTWEFRYEGHQLVTEDELHIPAGQPVQLELQSTDVIHSFWVPQLAPKRDALPDRPTFLVIEADDPGTYRGQCAEYCGIGHSFMELRVIAHGPSAWDEWLGSGR